MPIILIASFSVLSDEIFLKNGQKAKIKILDTNGCFVKILRNETDVSINKKMITKLVWKNDTIFFDDFVCSEKPPKVVKIEDTPEYNVESRL